MEELRKVMNETEVLENMEGERERIKGQAGVIKLQPRKFPKQQPRDG